MTDVNVAGADARIGGTFGSSFGIASRLGGQMNIPELILAIQVERGQILDNQIKDQMEEMQRRNATLRDLNAAMSAMRGERPDGKPDSKGNIMDATFIDSDGEEQNAFAYVRDLGVDVGVDWAGIEEAGRAKEAMDEFLGTYTGGVKNYPTFTDRNGNQVYVTRWAEDTKGIKGFDRGNSDTIAVRDEFESLQGKLGVELERGATVQISQTKWDDAIANIKTAVDTINNQSQMDMVRLQGLMDKRNQAFDMMTNTISKSGKSLDGVIGNMR